MKTVLPWLASTARFTPLVLLCATACAPDAGSAGPYDPVTLELTTTEVTEPDVAVSPDGQSLVFTLVGHLFRIPIAGGEAEQLTFGLGYDFDPAFSPDGGRLAFVSDRDDTDGNVFVLDLGTRTVRQVTREELGAARPAWSPDGSRIAYLGLVKPELPDRPWLSNTYQTVVRTTTLNDTGPVSDITPVGFFTSVLYLRDGRSAWASVTPDNRVEWVFGRVHGPAVTRIITTHPDGTPDTLAVVAGMVHRLHHDPTGPGFIARQIPDPIPLGGGYEAERVARIAGDGGGATPLLDVTGTNGWDWGPGIAIDTARDRIVLGEEGRLLAISIADPGDTVVIPFRARVRREAYPPVPARDWTPPARTGTPPLEIPAAAPLPDGSGILVVAAGQLWRLVEGEDATRIYGPSGWIQDMALSPGGDVTALVVGRDNLQLLQLHDLRSGTTRDVSGGRHYGRLAWSRDGQVLTFRDGRSGPYEALDTGTGRTSELPDSTAMAELTGTPVPSGFFYRRGHLYRVAPGAADTTEVLADARFSFPAPPSVLIRGARVLDLKAGSFTDPTSVLVDDGRIRALGGEADRLASEGIRTIAADGRYLVPGLFDLHVHHYGMRESYVVFGVTSVREVGGGNGTLADIRIYADLGNFHAGPYPRNFHSGIIYGSPVNLDDQPLAALREAGGSWAKAYATLPWSAQTRIAEDARAVGLPVAAHGLTRREVVKGISLGFASLEHIGWGPREDLLHLMRAADILWVPTLAVMAGISPGDPRPLDPFTSAAIEAFAWDTTRHETDENPHGSYSVRRAVYARQLESVGRAYQMGIRISAGTDPSGYPVSPGLGLHLELEHLVRTGIPPIDVLRMATLTAAGEVGAGDELGSIEVGKLADLVLLDANPLEDIRNTRRIWRVIKGGWVLDPAAIMADLASLRERAEDQPTNGSD